MNFFSIILMGIIIALILIPFFVLFKKKRAIGEKMIPWLLPAIVFLMVIYLQFGIARDYAFVSPDEGIFLQNFANFEEGKNILSNHSSGPAVVFFVYWIKQITNLPVEEIMLLIKLLFALAIPLVAFAAIKRITKNRALAFFSVLAAFLSSHFIWPFMEARPELFGLAGFFGAILAVEFYLREKRAKFLIISTVVISLLAPVHFWSMIMASVVFFFCFFFFDLKAKKQWAACVIAVALAFFLFFSSFDIAWDIHFAVRESMGLGGQISESRYSELLRLHTIFDDKIKLSVIVFAITVLPAIALVFFELFLRKIIMRAKKRAIRIISENKKKAALAGAAVAILAIISQTIFYSEELAIQYGNIAIFFVLQSGNIFFIFLFLAGFLNFAGGKAAPRNIFYFIAPIAMIIGFAFLTTPFAKIGFHNFAIRAFSYIIPLGAVASFIGLKQIFESRKITRIIGPIIAISILASVLLGTRDPTIFSRSGFFEEIEVKSYTNLTTFLNKSGFFSYEKFDFPHAPDNEIKSLEIAFDKIYSTKKRSAYLERG